MYISLYMYICILLLLLIIIIIIVIIIVIIIIVIFCISICMYIYIWFIMFWVHIPSISPCRMICHQKHTSFYAVPDGPSEPSTATLPGSRTRWDGCGFSWAKVQIITWEWIKFWTSPQTMDDFMYVHTNEVILHAWRCFCWMLDGLITSLSQLHRCPSFWLRTLVQLSDVRRSLNTKHDQNGNLTWLWKPWPIWFGDLPF